MVGEVIVITRKQKFWKMEKSVWIVLLMVASRSGVSQVNFENWLTTTKIIVFPFDVVGYGGVSPWDVVK